MSKDLRVWCVSCWKKNKILEPYIYHFKKNKRNGVECMCALCGTCSVCGNKMSRVLPKEYSCRTVDYVVDQLINTQ